MSVIVEWDDDNGASGAGIREPGPHESRAPSRIGPQLPLGSILSFQFFFQGLDPSFEGCNLGLSSAHAYSLRFYHPFLVELELGKKLPPLAKQSESLTHGAHLDWIPQR
jgi:hypothetical protein